MDTLVMQSYPLQCLEERSLLYLPFLSEKREVSETGASDLVLVKYLNTYELKEVAGMRNHIEL